MLQFIQLHRNYLVPYLVLVFLTLLMLIFIPKGEEVLWLNQFYNPLLSNLFVWFTRLGEEIVAIAIGIGILMFMPYRYVFGYIIATLALSLIIYVFKHYIYSDALRPVVLLKEYPLQLVKELHINTRFSFPSGHTATAFAVFSYVAFSVKNKYKFFLIIFPFLAGLSRIYLVQHFLIDVVAGSVLGVFIASIAYYSVTSANISETHWLNKRWLA